MSIELSSEQALRLECLKIASQLLQKADDPRKVADVLADYVRYGFRTELGRPAHPRSRDDLEVAPAHSPAALVSGSGA